MKLTKISMGLMALTGLLAFSPSVRAQENGSTNVPPVRRGGMMQVDAQLARLTERLKLTDEQKPKVKAVLEDQNKQMQAARELPQEQRRSKMQSIHADVNKKMKEILTPEQYTKYEEMFQRARPRHPGGAPGTGNPQ